jgi:arsenate reductase (thioredoxin)
MRLLQKDVAMPDRVFNVLFLCTHNSARSVMAEALLNVIGSPRFKAFSAGSYPSGKPNPFALEQVKTIGYPVETVRSKSWDEFAQPNSPHMDIIITVCDNAAGEACPIWPGHPATAHWGFPDPSDTEGGDDAKRAAFAKVFTAIRQRIQLLADLRDDQLAHLSLSNELKRIAKDTTT